MSYDPGVDTFKRNPAADIGIGVEIYIIDADHRRRAELAFRLHGEGYNAVPHDPLDQLVLPKDRMALCLCHDEGNAIFDLFKSIGQPSPNVILFCYATQTRLRNVVRALQAGAIEYFDLPDEIDALIAAAVHTASTKQAQPASWLQNVIRKSHARTRVNGLTGRELDVLKLASRGLSSRLIGERLGIHQKTVETHRSSILNKTGSHSITEAVRWAMEGGII